MCPARAVAILLPERRGQKHTLYDLTAVVIVLTLIHRHSLVRLHRKHETGHKTGSNNSGVEEHLRVK